MVELILQGDDVTHQMWRMYSVFEEIFGRQTMTTSTNQPLKHVVVGADRLKNSPKKAAPPSPLVASSTKAPATTISTTSAVTTTAGQVSSSTTVCTTPKDLKEALPEEERASASSPQNKVQKLSLPSPTPSPKSSVPPSSCSSPGGPQSSSELSQPKQSGPSNPLLDTIGALANSNPDSDDSDLDMVYQQLRYRGRQQRRQDQMKTRAHRHQQIASSDPDSIAGYAGSNSIDSGYKSLCATPEVSDTLSAPEVRRSASDVSASDSSTTSGRPRSLDGSAKVRMGTRAVKTKRQPQPVSAATMNDVTLDHLMYLRQSLRKDRADPQRSPADSLPSSATSSTFRDSDLSPRTLTDEEWGRPSPQLLRPLSAGPTFPQQRGSPSSFPQQHGSPSSFLQQHGSPSSFPQQHGSPSSFPQQHGSPSAFTQQHGSPSPFPQQHGSPSAFPQQHEEEMLGNAEEEFLLRGAEYYDLESIQEFPTSAGNNYVTLMEEKTRRFQVVQQTPRSSELLTERQLSSLYRKRSSSTDGDSIYGHHRSGARHSAKALASRQNQRQHHATDSKLTEAAIRVLEMIEDFRMEEAITRSGRVLQPNLPPEYHQHHHGAPPLQYPLEVMRQHHPRAYRKSGRSRPASTGSLMEQDIDVRSVASSSTAEHHVYEEIMYDLVCERGQRGMPPPIPPGRIVSRSRLLPVVPPHPAAAVDPRRIVVRSHKHRSSSNVYAVNARTNVDRFVEWQDRRDTLSPEYPV
ncbi:hypothetical protein JTE90_011336 [Oedothorax gibbosus]|uniref:Uncharacterized protein n=1 Tax=Oedothorax gibbosus TaxID=931172 RepID=A0AAV6VN87_9ARAC|nr:hypothetical protein JTE90_011336 [Oedothorax gibbosus]